MCKKNVGLVDAFEKLFEVQVDVFFVLNQKKMPPHVEAVCCCLATSLAEGCRAMGMECTWINKDFRNTFTKALFFGCFLLLSNTEIELKSKCSFLVMVRSNVKHVPQAPPL